MTDIKVARLPKNYEINATIKRKAQRTKCFSEHKRNLRKSITPGTVLILLTGAYKGRHVVFLKQLESGLLLVNGPFKLNGVPMRRVHQKLVIATKTKLDLSNLDMPEHLNDAYFKKQTEEVKKENDIFASKKQVYTLKDERKADQKLMDASLTAAIKAREDKAEFAKYLRSIFSLSHGDKPHAMTF